MKRTTKAEAKKTLDLNKENTSYFDYTMSEEEFYNMLRYRMFFGEAETKAILSAMILAGAKFKNN